ncbi:hypothetical protein LR48_Vigan09g005600 [Vigna angularis]|uniref:UBC core domain-containing protein n=1 Tax=Phaseolus angularis TaxID=3914 RepID=A0A0L9V923_PHAAN|nr:hypothetical protein LR48_Vigan09g005600 [Vigna angularis]
MEGRHNTLERRANKREIKIHIKGSERSKKYVMKGKKNAKMGRDVVKDSLLDIKKAKKPSYGGDQRINSKENVLQRFKTWHQKSKNLSWKNLATTLLRIVEGNKRSMLYLHFIFPELDLVMICGRRKFFAFSHSLVILLNLVLLEIREQLPKVLLLPYQDRLFCVDVSLPSSYPTVPRKVHYHSGRFRLKPKRSHWFSKSFCWKQFLSLMEQKKSTSLSYHPPPKPPNLNLQAIARGFPLYDNTLMKMSHEIKFHDSNLEDKVVLAAETN